MASTDFTSEFFAGNRARLRELFTGTAPIVVTANGLLQQAGDEAYPFAQDASFWYLTGIDEPDVTLVLDRDKEYLVVPGRDESRAAFDGALDTDMLSRQSGVAEVLDAADGWHQLERRLKKAKHVATLGAAPRYDERIGMYANPSRAELIAKCRQANPDIALLDLRVHLARLRAVKQPEELAALQRAIAITAATLKEISRPARLATYSHEYEIEADITRGFRRRGASGHGFPPIIASGGRACVLHNMANSGTLASDELVVMDVGAAVDHYSADITRTYALGKDAPRRARAVHAAVCEVQDYACSLLRPGSIPRDYERQVETYMGEKLRELNLIKTIDSGAVRHFYPHATSHFLGLNVHDVGDYSRPLEPGMVLTVEPGIYIPAEGIGVREEQDVLITPDGNQLLTAALPRAQL